MFIIRVCSHSHGLSLCWSSSISRMTTRSARSQRTSGRSLRSQSLSSCVVRSDESYGNSVIWWSRNCSTSRCFASRGVLPLSNAKQSAHFLCIQNAREHAALHSFSTRLSSPGNACCSHRSGCVCRASLSRGSDTCDLGFSSSPRGDVEHRTLQDAQADHNSVEHCTRPVHSLCFKSTMPSVLCALQKRGPRPCC